MSCREAVAASAVPDAAAKRYVHTLTILLYTTGRLQEVGRHKPRFESYVRIDAPLSSDWECLAVLRKLLRENQTAIETSRAALNWSRNMIALLGRLEGPSWGAEAIGG
jgi:hypothetical protein